MASGWTYTHIPTRKQNDFKKLGVRHLWPHAPGLKNKLSIWAKLISSMERRLTSYAHPSYSTVLMQKYLFIYNQEVCCVDQDRRKEILTYTAMAKWLKPYRLVQKLNDYKRENIV